MRVIAGSARGIPLITRKSRGTRPTLDRIKENLFNILNFKIPETVVADFFSGSGSLCIECLSRGSSKAYFIEKNREAYKCIISNLEKTRLQDNAVTLNMDFNSGAEVIKESGDKLDIIFLDPPHKKGLVPKAMNIIKYLQLLKKDGIIIVEHHTQEFMPDFIEGFVLDDRRVYSNTTLSFYVQGEED